MGGGAAPVSDVGSRRHAGKLGSILRMTTDELEVLAYEESPIGMICLRRRSVPSAPETQAFEITVDHQFLMSSLATASERELARRALELHGGHELRVLVGGLGLGYTAEAALATGQAAQVEVVELLPQVIGWLKRGLIPLSAALLADGRLLISEEDVYRRLLHPPVQRHDVILLDVDTSPDRRLGEVSARFYSPAGLAAAAEHLSPGGVFAVWSYAESAEFEQAMRSVFGKVRVEPVDFKNPMLDEDETNWLFFGTRE